MILKIYFSKGSITSKCKIILQDEYLSTSFLNFSYLLEKNQVGYNYDEDMFQCYIYQNGEKKFCNAVKKGDNFFSFLNMIVIDRKFNKIKIRFIIKKISSENFHIESKLSSSNSEISSSNSEYVKKISSSSIVSLETHESIKKNYVVLINIFRNNQFIENEYIALHIDSIFSLINLNLLKGVNFFDIVQDFQINDLNLKIKFCESIWNKCLFSDRFPQLIEFFTEKFSNFLNHPKKLKELHENIELMNRLKIFIYDLKYDSFIDYKVSNFTSLKFPNSIFSLYYFNEEEIEFLLNFPLASGLTFDENFKLILDSKYIACASHNINPLIFHSFNFKKNDIDNDGVKKISKAYNKQKIKDFKLKFQ